MAPKQKTTTSGETSLSGHSQDRRPHEKHPGISDEGRKWQQENADAADAWASWVEKNGAPLPPRF